MKKLLSNRIIKKKFLKKIKYKKIICCQNNY